MTTQNPQVLRTHFTELALHLAIDPTEHPSDIIQETIRRLEYLKHDHRTLLTRYDEAQQARIRNPAELVEEIEDLDRDNAKLQRRYVALAQRCRELKAECQGLGRECEALRERVGGQERLIGELGELGDVLEMYVASSREGFEGIRVSAEGFLGEVAEVLGFRGDDGFDQEVVLGESGFLFGFGFLFGLRGLGFGI